jgi:hypothetical protein
MQAWEGCRGMWIRTLGKLGEQSLVTRESHNDGIFYIKPGICLHVVDLQFTSEEGWSRMVMN